MAYSAICWASKPQYFHVSVDMVKGNNQPGMSERLPKTWPYVGPANLSTFTSQWIWLKVTISPECLRDFQRHGHMLGQQTSVLSVMSLNKYAVIKQLIN